MFCLSSSWKLGFSTICLWLLLLSLVTGTEALTGRREPSANELQKHTETRKSSVTFVHRHSFYHDADSRHPGLSTFHVVDSHDILRHATRDEVRLASFDLRPQELSSLVKHHNSDSRILIMPTHGYTEPNVTDKQTVVNLAKMTSDAYIFDPGQSDWLNTSLGFNFTARFGWTKEGLRGHIFTTEDNSTVVVSFKGTTIDPRDKISGKDRFNDNTLFSCCCGAQNPWPYAPVCNCSTGRNQCDAKCLTSALLQNDTYYDAALFMVKKFQGRYPKAAFWTTGHSLGGALASLVGMTLNIPAVTFEAPPERLPAERMGIIPASSAERYTAYHFGNTADPIYMGECNGLLSSCAVWGFVFDSKCSTGYRCTYDTIKDKGWRSNIANHRINYVIQNVLEAYDDVPKCEAQTGCSDCAQWNFTDTSLSGVSSQPLFLQGT